MLSAYQSRLGLFRRNGRNYSLHNRKYGKSAADRMLESKYQKMSQLFAVLAVDIAETEENGIVNESAQEELDMLFLSWKVFRDKAKSFKRPILQPPDTIPNRKLSLNSFTDQQIEYKTGFSKVDIRNLVVYMKVPASFKLGSGKFPFN